MDFKEFIFRRQIIINYRQIIRKINKQYRDLSQRRELVGYVKEEIVSVRTKDLELRKYQFDKGLKGLKGVV